MKTCSRCRLSKSLDLFSLSKTRKHLDGRQNYCRDCVKEIDTLRLVAAHRLIDNIKDVPCADCNKKYPPYVMDFDHLPGTAKEFSIGQSVKSLSENRVRKEIGKCEIVCANCHRERTHQRETSNSQ